MNERSPAGRPAGLFLDGGDAFRRKRGLIRILDIFFGNLKQIFDLESSVCFVRASPCLRYGIFAVVDPPDRLLSAKMVRDAVGSELVSLVNFPDNQGNNREEWKYWRVDAPFRSDIRGNLSRATANSLISRTGNLITQAGELISGAGKSKISQWPKAMLT